jgi:major membrane immunogen (membrane-anchored lipoprotein)
MMMRATMILAAVAAASLLAACGERDQSLAKRSHHEEPWKGAKNNFVAKTWTPGTKEAWETQLRTRAMTQNEYNKTN